MQDAECAVERELPSIVYIEPLLHLVSQNTKVLLQGVKSQGVLVPLNPTEKEFNKKI